MKIWSFVGSDETRKEGKARYEKCSTEGAFVEGLPSKFEDELSPSTS